MTEATSLIAAEEPSRLERTIGFWGLTFVSLGSIIGSGWLLGALRRTARSLKARSW